jgi:hypothetical protein
VSAGKAKGHRVDHERGYAVLESEHQAMQPGAHEHVHARYQRFDLGWRTQTDGIDVEPRVDLDDRAFAVSEKTGDGRVREIAAAVWIIFDQAPPHHRDESLP